MGVKEIVGKVLDSDIFKSRKDDHSYLVSCFFMNDVWSVDFYSKETKKVTSFIFDEDVKISEEDKVFQRDEKELEELKLEEVKVSLDEALMIVNDVKEEKAKGEDIQKKIIILQKQKFALWNITYILSSFNLLNVKINAINGNVIEKGLSPAFNFRTK